MRKKHYRVDNVNDDGKTENPTIAAHLQRPRGHWELCMYFFKDYFALFLQSGPKKLKKIQRHLTAHAGSSYDCELYILLVQEAK